MFKKIFNKQTIIIVLAVIFVVLSIYITTKEEDTKAPVIKLKGDKIVELKVGSKYKESGATVTDNSNAKISAKIDSSDVNVKKVGTYEVTYNAKDGAGNKAKEVVRTVKVVAATTTTPEKEEEKEETTKTPTNTNTNTNTNTSTPSATDTVRPLIFFKGSRVMTVELGSKFTEPGAYAKDNSGITPSLRIYRTVNTSVIGTYKLIYVSYDAAGNKASTIRTVNVVDTTAPVITLTGSNTVNVEINTTYTELGATVTDNSGAALTATISGSVDTTKLGTYTVTYTATDASGNTGTVTRTVNVVDTTKPIVTLTGAATITLTVGDTYTELGATVTDNSLEAIAAVITGTVDTTTAGTYTVTYTATDASGNTATVTRTVNVVEGLDA